MISWFNRILYFIFGVVVALYVWPYIPKPYQVDYWSGSGFFITTDGYIATADHVVDGATKLGVRYHGKWYPAYVVARDTAADVAILKTDLIATTPLFLNPKITEQAPVAIIGHSLGSINAKMTVGSGSTSGWVITGVVVDAVSCEGNSGGPIIDSKAFVVAILTQGLEDEDGCSPRGWGPSSKYVQDLANSKLMLLPINTKPASHNFNYLFSRIIQQQQVVLVTGTNE